MGDSLEDVIATGLSVVFCGINPGRRAAEVGHHFAGHGNRFWRVIHFAGFTPVQMRPEDGRELLKYHCGLTTAVSRPTASADELSKRELAAAALPLELKIRQYEPRYIAFLGKAAYLAISGSRDIQWGRQAALFGPARVWILPNPSGLNRAFSLEDLVCAYRRLRLVLDA